MEKFDKDTCVVVVSCDKYDDAWEPFFMLKNKYWKNNYKTFLITENKKCKYCETINVNEKIWTKRFREALKKIDYKYVILLLEDFFIREPVKQNKIEEYIKNFPKDAAVVHFVDGNNYIKSNILDLYLKTEDAHYKCNCQCGIWDRDKLISLLANDGSAWDWELNEPCVSGYKYYANPLNEIINYGYGIYGFGIYRGKWNVRDVGKLFKKEGITVDFKKRGISHDYKIVYKISHGIKSFFYPLYKIYCKIVGKEYGKKNNINIDFMNPNDLKELRKVQLEILDEIIRIANKYNLQYFLFGGTLIGAVRHKGYIPWDDDIDIGMFQEDYIKFLELAPKELNDKYFIDDVKYNKYYYLWFAKVKKKGTLFVENSSSNMKNINKAIFVDIFPLGNTDKIDFKYKIRFYKFYLLQLMICAKNNMYNSLFGKFLKVLSLPFTTHYLTTQQVKTALKNNNSKSKYIANFADLNVNNVYERTDLLPLKKVQFEGKKYYGFKDNDLFLTSVYGDYMTLPPVEKRVTHKPIAIEILDDNNK